LCFWFFQVVVQSEEAFCRVAEQCSFCRPRPRFVALLAALLYRVAALGHELPTLPCAVASFRKAKGIERAKAHLADFAAAICSSSRWRRVPEHPIARTILAYLQV
jgi:hypothetical protein